jgi:hypothetical protein
LAGAAEVVLSVEFVLESWACMITGAARKPAAIKVKKLSLIVFFFILFVRFGRTRRREAWRGFNKMKFDEKAGKN